MLYLLISLLSISSFLYSDEVIINSQLLDYDENPIINANIYCDKKGTVSDNNGNFILICQDSQTLVISHINYKTLNFKTNSIPNTIYLSNNYIEIGSVKIYGSLKNKSYHDVEILDELKFKLNGKNHFQDIISNISNLNNSGGTSRPRYFQIRGLGELSQFAGEGPPHFYVGYILDDINFSGIGMLGLLNDIKQIEIFKGPQSSIYGPNSMAGLINTISNNPNSSREFRHSLTMESFNGVNLSTVLNLPITKNLTSRFTLIQSRNDGYINNIYRNLDNTNSQNETLLRSKFLYKPNKTTKINLTTYRIVLNNKYDKWSPDNNGYLTYSDYQGYDKQKTIASSLKSTSILENFNIVTISSYSENNMHYSYDGDWANNSYWLEEYNFNWQTEGYSWSFTDETFRTRITKSQEIRIEDFSIYDFVYTGGIFIQSLNEEDQRIGSLFGGDGNIYSKFDIKNYAIYNQLLYSPIKNVNITLTHRNDINKTSQNLSYNIQDWTDWEIITDNIYTKIEDNGLIGGSINIEIIHERNLFYNISLSKGYKTSGINQSPNFYDSYKTYNKETCYNLEFLIKKISENYNITLKAFQMKRYNPQLRLFFQFTDDPTDFDYGTFNAKSGYNNGIEFDLNVSINNNFKLFTSIGLLKTHISSYVLEYPGLQNNIFGNRALAHSPEINFIIGLEFNPFAKYNDLVINIETNYMDEFLFDDLNNHKSSSYYLTNTSIKNKFNNIELSIWCKNLFNEEYAERGYTFNLDPSGISKDYKSFGSPRVLGLTVNYSM